MNRNVTAGIVVIVMCVVFAAGWIFLPAWRDPQAAVNADAALEVERARRLLNNYSVDLMRSSLMRDRLLEYGVDIDVEDPEALAEKAADAYQEQSDAAWDAYQPTDWSKTPRAAEPNYGNVGHLIRVGIDGRAALIDANPEFLAEAERAVQSALSISRGDADSRAYTEANRLKGIIQYHRGLAEWLHANSIRHQGDPFRRRLMDNTTEVLALRSAETRVADSGLDGKIQEIEQVLADREANLREKHEELTSLEVTIAQLESRLAEAQASADAARNAMDGMEAAGVDFSDPAGADTFAQKFMQNSQDYRQAVRTVRSLQAGSIPNAQLERPGDYLDAEYVENGSTALTHEHGLRHYENDRAVLAETIAVEKQGIQDLRAAIERLEGMKAAYRTEEERAAKRIPDAVAAGQSAFDELSRVDSEASAIEEEALDLFEKSARSLSQAAANAATSLAEARDRGQALPAGARDRSPFVKRERDGWIEGHIDAQVADARLARAWIFHQQYNAYRRSAALLEQAAEPLQLREASASSEKNKADEAHDAGVAEITAAVAALKKAHRQADRHWTFVAQEAGAAELMALFGNRAYIDAAIDAYRNAVSGREDDPHARPFVARLESLENM